MSEALPHLNAGLNLASGVLLLCGWHFAKRRRIAPHVVCMVAALACSAAFLASYTFRVVSGGYVEYAGTGLDLYVYRGILASHAVLAAAVPVLALRTAYLGLRRRLPEHRRWARVALPVWLYVSATGLVIYAILFGWPAPGAGA